MHLFHRVTRFDAHHRFLIALLFAGVGFAMSFRVASVPVRLLIPWDVFSIASTAMAWTRIFGANAKTSVRTARLQDSSRATIFLLVITSALASLLAVGALLASSNNQEGGHATGHVLLAVGTIVCSWLLTHTLFTLRYAHLFYRQGPDEPKNAAGSGLIFPGEEHPDFLDFAYFAFVIGMTCQVSDVQITSRQIRSTALLHGLLSFAFNTVILALCLNLASGLI